MRRPADRSWVSYEPVGVVLAVMPWNFPLWQVFRFAAPALMAGNAALLKHSPNTTGAALACQDILLAAGLPDGLFTALLVAEPEVPATTERLIADPRVGAVTITGSERAGSAVGAIAGREIKKSVLELGGSDPFVVLADADLPRVAHLAVRGRFLNAGQSCISPKRFIVEAVGRRTVHRAGDRRDPSAERGGSRGAGHRGGSDGPRAICAIRWPPRCTPRSPPAPPCTAGDSPATIWAGFSTRPPCWVMSRPPCRSTAEEVFGPVAAIITVADAEEAVAVANDTPFGLGASVWSADVQAAVAVGRRITSGACFINALVASDARMPFGGTKRSGYGRELAGPGIREFVNIRTWWALNEPQAHAPTSE